jgi:hypothetical protein
MHKTLCRGHHWHGVVRRHVVVNANGRLGVVASSARYKQGIEPLGDASSMAERLQQLRPVSFRYKAEPEATHYPGALRHESAAVQNRDRRGVARIARLPQALRRTTQRMRLRMA